ncbi:alpha-ketoglutarate-dependent dioxygenase AlkB [Jatrophihabitans sp. YIM 134969]
MTDQQALVFGADESFVPDPAAGGLAVAVDRSFASVHRTQLDATSWVDHVPGWFLGDDALVEFLAATATWERRSRWMYTRQVEEPRLTAEYPVIAEAPHPVFGWLARVLGQRYGRNYTALWMNWYRDQDDSTGWHADAPAARLPEATVPVLSLGATRRFLVRPAEGGPSTSFTVHGGDLVVMGGRCQKDWRHMVPKQRAVAGGRMSLNFSV